MSEAPTRVANTESKSVISKYKDSFDLLKSLGKFTEKLSRVSMNKSMEKTSYKLQMDTAVLVETKIAEVQARRELPEGMFFRKNPNRKEPIDIIRRGLEMFEEKNPNVQIVFDLSEKRVSEIDYVHIVGKEIRETGFLPEKKIFAKLLYTDSETPLKARVAAQEANLRMTEDLLESSKELFLYFQESDFVSQENLLAKALELSDGKVFEAVDMVANVTKTLVRPENYFRGEVPEKEWYENLRKKISDELSDLVPFGDLTMNGMVDTDEKGRIHKRFDYSLENRLGEIYHFWEIVKLTRYFTPEMVRTMTMGEYYLHLEEQGHIKLLSDLRVLADLYEIEGLFKKESTRSST